MRSIIILLLVCSTSCAVTEVTQSPPKKGVFKLKYILEESLYDPINPIKTKEEKVNITAWFDTDTMKRKVDILSFERPSMIGCKDSVLELSYVYQENIVGGKTLLVNSKVDCVKAVDAVVVKVTRINSAGSEVIFHDKLNAGIIDRHFWNTSSTQPKKMFIEIRDF